MTIRRRVAELISNAQEREHHSFVNAAYRGCLRRDPDPAGLDMYLDLIESGKMTWADVLRSIVASPEFRTVYTRSESMNSLHQARMLLFRTHLPQADVILDLGGAAEHQREGALFALGYPYTPRELTIVDLPPDVRFTGADTAEREQHVTAERGTRITYAYRSMSDLGFVPDSSVDLVVSGESIEHITEADADLVCQHVFRALKPGGHFCLDTPNARLTRLESPDNLIHPEHKKEYYPHELRDKLANYGFAIEKELGICPMPESVQESRFRWDEMFLGARLTESPEHSYLFYIHARKPQ